MYNVIIIKCINIALLWFARLAILFTEHLPVPTVCQTDYPLQLREPPGHNPIIL
jgi:hypothetical protein